MKFKNCVNCGKYKYIEGNGLCRSCYNSNSPSYDFTYTSAQDRLNGNTGGHQLVIGKKGSGRTVGNKLELYDAIMNSSSKVYIIDQTGEYEDLINEVGGEYFDLSVYDCLNLMRVEQSSSNHMSLATRIKRIVDLLKRCYAIAGLVMDKIREKVLVTVIKEAYTRNNINVQTSTHSNKSPCVSNLIDILDDMRSNPSKFPNFNSYNDQKKIKRTLKHLHLELRDIDNRLGITQNVNKDFSGKDTVCFDISSIKSINIRGVRTQMILNEILEYAKIHTEKDILYIDDAETLFSAPASTLESIGTIFRHSRYEKLGISVSITDNNGLVTSNTFQNLQDKMQYKRVHRMDNKTDEIQKTLQISDSKYSKVQKLDTGRKTDKSELFFAEPSSSSFSKESIEVDDSFLSEIH